MPPLPRRLTFLILLLQAITLGVSARAQAQTAPAAARPSSAAEALDLAAAAYEYGDMAKVVECARPVTEGALVATDTERATGFRLLGVGLYLTDRKEGARAAFGELLRLLPGTQLDPTVIRPEVVAFFKDLRRRHQAELARSNATAAAARRNFAWNFLPPAGQFQNGDRGKGWALLAIETAALGAAATTAIVLHSWQKPHSDFGGHRATAEKLKTVNIVSVGVLAASVVAGIVDGMLRFDRAPAAADGESHMALQVSPFGASFALSF